MVAVHTPHHSIPSWCMSGTCSPIAMGSPYGPLLCRTTIFAGTRPDQMWCCGISNSWAITGYMMGRRCFRTIRLHRTSPRHDVWYVTATSPPWGSPAASCPGGWQAPMILVLPLYRYVHNSMKHVEKLCNHTSWDVCTYTGDMFAESMCTPHGVCTEHSVHIHLHSKGQ